MPPRRNSIRSRHADLTERPISDLRVGHGRDQWKPGDALHGELPVKKEPDSNADPSGRTRSVHYDFGSSTWLPGRGR